MIEFEPGLDIFEADVEMIVNPVNCVGVMGKGLALAFKRRFPQIMGPYVEACTPNRQGVRALQPGLVQLVRLDRASGQLSASGDLHIANLATKDHFRDPSRFDWVEMGIRRLKHAIKTRGISSVAIPKIGAGLGGLEWPLVRASLERHLTGMPGVKVVIIGEPQPQASLERRLVEIDPGEVMEQYAEAMKRQKSATFAIREHQLLTHPDPYHGRPAIAGVGSRKTPLGLKQVIESIGRSLSQDGIVLRSGAADKADEWFENGWRAASGDMRIFLPEPNFRGRKETEKDVLLDISSKHHDVARHYHGKYEALSRFGRGAMARNASQVLGQCLDDPVRALICWTEGGKEMGGTGQALRMARGFGIPILNLGREEWATMSAGDMIREALLQIRATVESKQVRVPSAVSDMPRGGRAIHLIPQTPEHEPIQSGFGF